jgi:hypothetical protein
MGLLGIAAVVFLSYPGVLGYLESTYGDLGNLNVMETYVPWIFHLLLLMVLGVIGVCLMGLWLLIILEPEQPPIDNDSLVAQAERDLAAAKPLSEASIKAAESAAQKLELNGITQMEEIQDHFVKQNHPVEPQVVSVNVAEKKPEDQAPESWKNEEEWEN